MIKSVIKGAIGGGLVAFLWLFISWMVLPWHHHTMHTFPKTAEAEVQELLAQKTPHSGIYTVPRQDGEQSESPLFAFIAIKKSGMQNKMALQLINALLFYMLVAGMLSLVLYQTNITGFFRRVSLVQLAGIAGAYLVLFNNWNWFGFDDLYILVEFIDTGINLRTDGLGTALACARESELTPDRAQMIN